MNFYFVRNVEKNRIFFITFDNFTRHLNREFSTEARSENAVSDEAKLAITKHNRVCAKLFSHGHCAPTAHTDNNAVTWDTAVAVTTCELKSRDSGFESRPQAIYSELILVFSIYNKTGHDRFVTFLIQSVIHTNLVQLFLVR
jgi:hypothetical protein